MKISNLKKYIAFITGLLSIGAEVYLAKFIPDCALLWVQYCFMGFVVVLFLLLYLIKKGGYILQSFLVVFHNHAGTVPGIFMIIYLLVQTDLAGSSFHEYLSGKTVLWNEPLIFLAFLFFPFLLQSFAVDEKNKKVDKEKRRVLVTALSSNKGKLLSDFKENNFDRDKIIKATGRPFWNWTSFEYAFYKYPKIDRVIFLIDETAKAELKAYRDNEQTKGEDILQTYLDQLSEKLKRSLDKREIYLDDINNFDAMYDEVKPVIEGELAKYNDEQIMFNISAGTATVTATLVFLSVKGKRGFCYLEQKDEGAKLKEFNVSAYDLKELWNEIIEKL